jgi:hypothetical protein
VSGARAAPPRWKSPAAADALCLAAITAISALPYLPNLGFYSDDWGFLAGFSAERGQSLAVLAGGNFPARPVQGLYLALLFKLFGLSPLGYHIVNTLVLALSAALFDLLLVRLRFGRARSFAAAILFVMLPQLSTVRVWYSAFQIPLSLALMLASMHCQLSFARSRTPASLAGAVGAAVLSIGAYEVFAPLFAAFAAALMYERWRGSRGDRRAHKRIAIAAVLLGLLVAATILLKASSGRAGALGDAHRYVEGFRQLFRLDYDWRVDSGLNLIAMARTYFVAPVSGFRSGIAKLVGGQAGTTVAVIGILIAATAWWRLRTRDAEDDAVPAPRAILLGIAAFALGNGVFLIVPSIVFTSTGIGNRVQVAAAVGVAMIFASLVSLATGKLPPQVRSSGFAAAVALVTLAAFVRLCGIERYWAEAPALQARILSAARADLRGVPAGSTVILDGICPYHGPAILFEANWDVAGALTLALARPLNGDLVSPRMSVSRTGLITSIYREPSFYPYGPRLFIYDPTLHSVVGLSDAAVAAHYFRNRAPAACPGFVARGVAV